MASLGASTGGIRAQPVPTAPGTAARGPLFIVSMWRAGSSLLYALLNQHPQVALTYEADLPLLRPVFLKPAIWRDWPQRWEFWNSALSRHGVEPADARGPGSFREAFETVHRGYAAAKGATLWGDKSPNYYDRMTWLARKFPGSTFIVVWRDPLETARSMVRAAASGSSYFQKRGVKTRALVGYRVLRRQYRALLRDGVPAYAINYEDLTRDTRSTMEGVCQFLQIPFDPRVLTLEHADRSAVYEGAHHHSLKGDTLVREHSRPEVLEPAWRGKIARYVRLWQRQDKGWPAYPKPDPRNTAEPTIFERLLDQGRYRFWKLFDEFTAAAYSFAPLRVLQGHRNRKFLDVATLGTDPMSHQRRNL
jgi:Sulfotransferase family